MEVCNLFFKIPHFMEPLYFCDIYLHVLIVLFPMCISLKCNDSHLEENALLWNVNVNMFWFNEDRNSVWIGKLVCKEIISHILNVPSSCKMTKCYSIFLGPEMFHFYVTQNHIHRGLLLQHILSQFNWQHFHTLFLTKIHFNIMLISFPLFWPIMLTVVDENYKSWSSSHIFILCSLYLVGPNIFLITLFSIQPCNLPQR
jgi:hypothetical protein